MVYLKYKFTMNTMAYDGMLSVYLSTITKYILVAHLYSTIWVYLFDYGDGGFCVCNSTLRRLQDNFIICIYSVFIIMVPAVNDKSRFIPQ